MAGSVNKVIVLGNLGGDPEVKSFQNGGKVCTFSLATSQSWKDRQTGEKREQVEWHRVSILSDGLVGVAERYLRKGSKVYIEGQLRTRKWQDRDGRDCRTTEIQLLGPQAVLVLLDGKDRPAGAGAGDSGASGSGAAGRSSDDGAAGGWSGGDLDDEVPF